MQFLNQVTIAAPIDDVWAFVMDIPSVAGCVPGVESVEEVTRDHYRGVIGVKVGPIGLHLKGEARVLRRDEETRLAELGIEATDRRIPGNVTARSTMRLTPRDDGGTDLSIETDASILGKLGQFGQAVMKKKSEQVIGEFAANMSRSLSAR